ncbi:hypothetical protein KIW84_035755 [Lathyrus oleraceus]|uniref:Uncharacterized protein n=1 Tax=Pisum sativum TaxID=3888 RepID=A0A9D5B164_PEA|nr:hypothetical protein KIW84_035755 [Pisum sativum]
MDGLKLGYLGLGHGDIPEGNVEAARARALAEELKKKSKKLKLEGPSWTLCVFPPEDPDELPGGPKDTSVLASYKAHIARYHRLQLVPVSHGKKMRELAALVPNEQWFRDRVQATGLADLAKTWNVVGIGFSIGICFCCVY